MPINSVQIPFEICNIETGANEPWSVIFVREWINPDITDVYFQIPYTTFTPNYYTAAKLKSLGSIKHSFNLDTLEFGVPNMKITFDDSIKSTNLLSLFEFLVDPAYLSGTSDFQDGVYFLKEGNIQWVFRLDKKAMGFNSKNFELSLQLTLALNHFGSHLSWGEDLRYLSSLLELVNKTFDCVIGDFSHIDVHAQSLPSTTTRYYNSLTAQDWTQILLTSAIISLGGGKYAWDYDKADFKTVFTDIAITMQWMFGIDEYGEYFVKFLIDNEDLEQIPNSSIVSINFENFVKKNGVYDRKLWYKIGTTVYTLDNAVSRGTVYLKDDGDGNTVVTNTEITQEFDQKYRFLFMTDSQGVPAPIGSIHVHQPDSSYITYSATSDYVVKNYFLITNNAIGYARLELKGLTWKMYKNYWFEFYFANGTKLDIKIITLEIERDYINQKTILSGIAMKK